MRPTQVPTPAKHLKQSLTSRKGPPGEIMVKKYYVWIDPDNVNQADRAKALAELEIEIDFGIKHPHHLFRTGETCAEILESHGHKLPPTDAPFDSEIHHECFDKLELEDASKTTNIEHAISTSSYPKSFSVNIGTTNYITVRQHLKMMHRLPLSMPSAIEKAKTDLRKYNSRKTQLQHDLELYKHAFERLKKEVNVPKRRAPTCEGLPCDEEPSQKAPVLPTISGPPYDDHPNLGELMSMREHNILMEDYVTKLRAYVSTLTRLAENHRRFGERNEILLARYQEAVLLLMEEKFEKLGIDY